MGEYAAGQVVVEDLPTFVQAAPQGRGGWVGLPKECLCRHRLMGPFNDGVIGGTTFARKAHLDPQRKQPQMQPRWKRRGSRIVIEDRAVV